MKERRIRVPEMLPERIVYRAIESHTGEVLEAKDLAAIFRKIAESYNDSSATWFYHRWSLEVVVSRHEIKPARENTR